MTEQKEPSREERADDEFGLARVLVGRYRLASGTHYYGVNLISRNLKVTPDIDLLSVYTNPYHPEENTLVGFELKVLRYHEGRKRVEVAPFYQGVGQVLTYFQHGVDRAALVLGCHSKCENYPDAEQDASELVERQCRLLKESVLTSFPYLQIASLESGSLKWVLNVPDGDRQRYVPRTEEAKLRRASILSGQFSYRKRL